MLDGVPEMIGRCDVKDGKIVFCPLHGAGKNLFEAVDYAAPLRRRWPACNARAREHKGSDHPAASRQHSRPSAPENALIEACRAV
jgi:hypothetical protein